MSAIRIVTPLIGHFRGKVGICSFYRALLCLWCSPHCTLFSFLFRRVLARLQAWGTRDCNKGMHPTKGFPHPPLSRTKKSTQPKNIRQLSKILYILSIRGLREEILFIKNCGLTLKRGKNAVWGWQRAFYLQGKRCKYSVVEK